MSKTSAGVLLWKRERGVLLVLLVHPGGPFWAKKDEGAWSIPKGEYEEGDDAFTVAKREFAEELGSTPPSGEALSLGEIVQAGGKQVTGFALEGDFDPALLASNSFEMEWPPRSGRRQSFPEVDRAAWLSPEAAMAKINPGQRPFIVKLEAVLNLDRL